MQIIVGTALQYGASGSRSSRDSITPFELKNSHRLDTEGDTRRDRWVERVSSAHGDNIEFLPSTVFLSISVPKFVTVLAIVAYCIKWQTTV